MTDSFDWLQRTKADFVGGRSSRASKRATPIPDGVDSSDDYSDYEEGVRDDNLKGSGEEPVDRENTSS